MLLLQIALFIIFIVGSHQLWIYLKDHMTVKKKKDTNYEVEKYKKLLESQLQEKNNAIPPIALSIQPDPPILDLEQDLNQFLQEILV
jgi:hypothetical protein